MNEKDCGPRRTRTITTDWEPAPDDADLIYANFYRCPNTNEWVYKWTNERFVLVAKVDES